MVLFNGQLLDSPNVPLPNRAFTFGDGFFETMIFANGCLHLAVHHCQRMQRASEALYLELPTALATPNALTASMQKLVAATGFAQARVRLQLWRSGGGLYLPETNAAEWLATAVPYVASQVPVQQAGFALETFAIYSPLSFCKGPQAWLYVRAARERQQRGLDEIILCDAGGHVAEAGAAALFWEKDGMLFTPALETGCVAGVRRAQVLGTARAAGIECREGLFQKATLLAATSVFTANAAALRPVRRIENHKFTTALPPFLTAAQTGEKW